MKKDKVLNCFLKKILNLQGLIVAYVAVLLFEVFLCVPYHKIQVFKSAQNVPHTEIIGSGYDTVFNISNNTAVLHNNKDSATGKRINSQQLFINILLTTGVFSVLCFIKRKNNPIEEQNEKLKHESDVLKKQSKQLQDVIDSLSTENEKIKADKKECEDLLSRIIRTSSPNAFKNFPDLDINSLAFADTETQEKAKRKYAIDMYMYVKSNTEATAEMFESKQLSLDDAIPAEPPYIDFNEVAFADEDTARCLQQQ